VSVIYNTLVASWGMLVEAAPYIWVGLVVAGLLHAWIPQEWILSQLGGRGARSVWKAALLGAPLPLCSCGVIPMTVSLRKRGAGRGATLSFLISTPETSADSIALTWAMLGPAWAVIRPVAAVLTAVGTGLLANLFPDDARPGSDEDCACCGPSQALDARRPSGWVRVWRFLFRELLPDIGGWLLLGLLASGLIVALLPPDFLSNLPGGALVQMFAALLIGIPLYICASASTPLAAALLMKGMAPGAAVVLLLAGPATNLASAMVIARQLGRTGTIIYLGGVAVGSLLAGLAVQAVALPWNLARTHLHDGLLPPMLSELLACLLVLAIVVPWVYRMARIRAPAVT